MSYGWLMKKDIKLIESNNFTAMLGKMMKIVQGNGRYTAHAPEILYKSGVVFQRERKNISARAAFAEILEKHKKHELADDAGFQYAYIDFKKVTEATGGPRCGLNSECWIFYRPFPIARRSLRRSIA